MSSNIRLEKTCQHCNERFIAKTTVTKYCSDNCAKRAYKKRKRSEKIETAVKLEENPLKYDPLLSQKEFLTIKEACNLLGASRWTIYRLIENDKLNSAKLGRKTIIKRSDIDALF